MAAPLLEVNDVSRIYRGGGVFARRRVSAVEHVSFTIGAEKPEIFTIIGESGSGKTTLARMILAIVPPSSGVIRFRGGDLAAIRNRAARLDFMRLVQPIFQNPFEAFNPLKRLDRYLFMTARRFAGATNQAAAEQLADAALLQVGLSLAEVRRRYPHELSGGQLQRIAIARALISSPALIIGVDGRCLAAHGDCQSVPHAARYVGRVDHLHHPRPGDRLHDQRPHHHHAARLRGRGRRCARSAGGAAPSVFDPVEISGAIAGCGWRSRSAARRPPLRYRGLIPVTSRAATPVEALAAG